METEEAQMVTQHAFLRVCECCGRDVEYDDGELRGNGMWMCFDCIDTENFEATRDAFDAAEEAADRLMDDQRCEEWD